MPSTPVVLSGRVARGGFFQRDVAFAGQAADAAAPFAGGEVDGVIEFAVVLLAVAGFGERAAGVVRLAALRDVGGAGVLALRAGDVQFAAFQTAAISGNIRRNQSGHCRVVLPVEHQFATVGHFAAAVFALVFQLGDSVQQFVAHVETVAAAVGFRALLRPVFRCR